MPHEHGESSRAPSSSSSMHPLFTRRDTQQSASSGQQSPFGESLESSAQTTPRNVTTPQNIANAPETIQSKDKKRFFWKVDQAKPEHIDLCRSTINVHSSEGDEMIG
jgi:hypothetical protein